MIIGQKKISKSIPLTLNLKEQILQTTNPNILQQNGAILDNLYKIFKNRTQDHIDREGSSYTCYLEQKALSAFLKFADDVYKSRRHEAQGVFVGYYLHDEHNPNCRFAVCTHFLQATGRTTSFTCEMSTQDLAKYSEYCDKNHMMIIAHVHSHPGLSAFYSMPDSETLRTLFYASQNIGIVIDNLQNQYLAYKMYDGVKREEPIFVYNAEECLKEGKLIPILLSNVSHGSNFITREVVDFSKIRKPQIEEKVVVEEHDTKKKEEQNVQTEKINYLGVQLKSIEKKLEDNFSYTNSIVSGIPQTIVSTLTKYGIIEMINNRCGSGDNEHTKEKSLTDKIIGYLSLYIPIIQLCLLVAILILLCIILIEK